MAALTATELIETARIRGWLPSSPDAATDTELLAMMTSECRLGMAALLKKARGHYTSERAVLAMTSAGIALPKSASGQNLEAVEWYDGARYSRLEQCAPLAESELYALGAPIGWYMIGARLYVAPARWSGNVRVTYQALAPTLVASTAAVQILTVASATTFTVSANPTGFGTTLTLDFIRNAPGGEMLQRSTAATRSSTTYTIASTTGLSVGDWASLEGTSPLPQLPVEVLDLLALRVASSLALQSGAPNAQGLMALAERAKAEALTLLAPRGQGAVAIVSRHGERFGRARRRF